MASSKVRTGVTKIGSARLARSTSHRHHRRIVGPRADHLNPVTAIGANAVSHHCAIGLHRKSR
jgi:hypothetical protein